MNERHEARYNAPAYHDTCNPYSGAPPLGDDSAGNLEQHVAEKKDAGPHAEYLRRKSEVSVHRQRRVRDIHPVEIRNNRRNEGRENDIQVFTERDTSRVRSCRHNVVSPLLTSRYTRGIINFAVL